MAESIQPMQLDEWLQIVANLHDEFPRHELPEATIAQWYRQLAPLGAVAVATAVQQYIAEGHEFPPSSSGVLRKVAASPRRSWDEAWGELVRVIRRYGGPSPNRPAPAPFDDLALQRLVDNRGWAALCALPENDSTTYAQLRDAYREAQRQIEHEQAREDALRALGFGGAVDARAEIDEGMNRIERAVTSSSTAIADWVADMRRDNTIVEGD